MSSRPSLSEFRMSKLPLIGRCTGRTPRQHLYLVVDDWERGYSIHRVGEDDFDPDPNAGLHARPGDHPIARIEAQHPHSWSFAAHGSKILAMLPPEYSPGIPLFDTETAGMTVWPNPQSRGDFGSKPWYISVGGRLLAFVYPFVEVLGPQPPPTDRSWSWDSVEPPPPFVSSVVTGYAVHPDGRTVFVSVRDWRPDIPGKIYILKSRRSTFTFDMERLEWAHAGEEAPGRVCCCDVPPAPPAGAGCETMPAWKLGRDVFFGDPGSALGHLGATLLSDSTFCVVEGGIPMDCDGDTRTCVVKMTCFRLKYCEDGDLCTTHHRAYASLSYEVAHERMDRTQNPVAFWM
ncbi:hypothetical protein GQ55_7G280600 [Panicum hallii var. hallii]|uniref:DUF1618 domain-containing protein n=1 Tax=Panicum hallii var. hallii TaxID=1504633 RepID=A0A2T7CZW8_9POAL|nr:hypothetical protein GQ55_7G280600 [Panicum hallii var. hallii]